MKRFLLSIAAVAAAIIPLFSQSAPKVSADSIIGDYYVADEKNGDSKVRFIKNSEGGYDCQVFWIKDNIDPSTGKPWLDVKNPDKSLRNMRADRIFIIRNLRFNAEKKQWDDAKIYDPNRGIRVNVTCKLISPKELQVRGSVLGIGETMIWKKL